MTDPIVTPPRICERSDIEVKWAHLAMQHHRSCRIDRCVVKWAAYSTLVHFGKIAPQTDSPRIRAHKAGVPFPATTGNPGTSPAGIPKIQTFQQVLDNLTRLAATLESREMA
jgi:hypothetical protein